MSIGGEIFPARAKEQSLVFETTMCLANFTLFLYQHEQTKKFSTMHQNCILIYYLCRER